MKKLFLILILPLFGYSQSDNLYATFGNVGYTSQTMTLIDSAYVTPSGFGNKKFDFVTIVASSSATDSITVWTNSRADTTTWTQKSLINLTSGATVTFMSLTTAVEEYLINDPQAFRVRLLFAGEDGSTSSVIVQGKYGVR